MATTRFSSRLGAVILTSFAGWMALCSGSANAQYFTSSGSNGSSPNGAFPIDSSAPVVDDTGYSLYVGSPGTGTFSAMAGAVFKANFLSAGEGGTGNGSLSASGAGTLVQLSGTGNRLAVGDWGAGSMTVSAGAVVDASANSSGCSATATCNSYVSASPGSTGILAVTGSGSAVKTVQNFTVAGTYVQTTATGGSNFGTPGGTSTGTVNVLDGGTLQTQLVRLGFAENAAASLGSEKAFATVVIDGPGSQWLAGRDTVDNAPALFYVGDGGGTSGTVTVKNGGTLKIDGTGGATNQYDSLLLGGSNSGSAQGTLTVTGTGSSVQVSGNNPYIGVGQTGSGSQGTLNVLAGAQVSALLMNVGATNATGTVLIDGVGTQVTLSGVGTLGAAGATIGRSGGTGTMTVSNGGKLAINDGGGNALAIAGSPYLQVGRDSGSTGSLTITGAGSVVQMTSTSLAVPTSQPDNYNPYLAVGRYAGATGNLTISNGGQLLMDGNAYSSSGYLRSTTLDIGGNTDTDPANGGQGSAIVTGAGSAIRQTSGDGYIGVGVGTGGVGSLTIADQGSVSGMIFHVGRVGTGTLTMNDGILNLSGQQTASSTTPAGATLGIGVGGGTGTATLANGSQINITNLGSLGASLNIGGSGSYPLGTGSLTMSGASQLNITAASGLATLNVGRTGTGTLTASGASTINVGDGSVYIGRSAGSTGVLQLNSGSTLTAGFVGVGATQSGDGGAGHLILNDSTVNTTTMVIGSNGILSGDGGVIKASGDVILGGTLSPGNSPGRVTIECNLITLEGSKLILDVLGNSTGGYDVDHVILGNDATFDLSKVQVVFNFLGNTNPTSFADSGQFNLDNFLESLNLQTGAVTGLSSVFAPGQSWSDIFAPSQFSATSADYTVSDLAFSADGSVASLSIAAVPEPGTWALMVVGSMGLVWARRARVARKA